MTTPAAQSSTQGHCLCGAVQYVYDGTPIWTAHCHCDSCRRATSSAFATYVGIASERFRYTQGEAELTRYASSPGVERSFCRRCGSPVSFVGTRWPGEIHLYVGSLADSAAITPRAHVHVAEAMPWADLHDGLPRFSTTSQAGPPIRRGPAGRP